MTTMASSSRTESKGLEIHTWNRSSSPADFRHSHSSSSSAFASSSSSFAARSSTFLTRSSSPTRVMMNAQPSSSSPSLRFLINNRPTSPGRSISVKKQSNTAVSSNKKKTCMCSPTTHPGSFRCSLHKNLRNPHGGGSRQQHNGDQTSAYHSNSSRLNFRRSAMTNSLVRIGGVEGGDLVKRALAALIRPSSHQQRRRATFQPRPSRLSIMSKADDEQ